MDDQKALAQQLFHPDGDVGREVGVKMAEWNAPANAFVIDCLDIQPADHVLEIGFGPGEALAEVARLTPQGFVAGIDHSETMMKMAEERNTRAIIQDKIELTLGDASSMPFADDSFHKIFAVNVAHFWKDPLVELGECRRLLKVGGRLALFLVRPPMYPAAFSQSGLFFPREPDTLEQFLREAGLQNVSKIAKVFPFGEGFCVTGEK